MSIRLPLSAVVRPKNPAVLKEFFQQAGATVAALPEVFVEESDAGLVLNTLWQPDLERTIEHLKESLGIDLECSKPKIHFVEKDNEILEPVVKLTVVVSMNHIGAVVADLIPRRCNIKHSHFPLEGVGTITINVPISELFGFEATFKVKSRGEGALKAELAGYEPAPPPTGLHGPDAAEMRA